MKSKIGKLTVLVAVVASLGMSGKASAFGLNYLRAYYDNAYLAGSMNSMFQAFGSGAKTEMESKTTIYGAKLTPTVTAASTGTTIAPLGGAGTFSMLTPVAPTQFAIGSAVYGTGIPSGAVITAAVVAAPNTTFTYGVPVKSDLTAGTVPAALAAGVAVSACTAANAVAGTATTGAATTNSQILKLSAPPGVGMFFAGNTITGTGIPSGTIVTFVFSDNALLLSAPGAQPFTGYNQSINVAAGATVKTTVGQGIDNGATIVGQQNAAGLGAYYQNYGAAYNSYWTWLGYQNVAALQSNLANGAAALIQGNVNAATLSGAALDAITTTLHGMAQGFSATLPVSGILPAPLLGPAAGATTIIFSNTVAQVAPTNGIPTTDTNALGFVLNRFVVGDTLTGSGSIPANTTITAVNKATGEVTISKALTGGILPGTFLTASNTATATNPYPHGPLNVFIYGTAPAFPGNPQARLVNSGAANARNSTWYGLGAAGWGLQCYYLYAGNYYQSWYNDEAVRLDAVAAVANVGGLFGALIDTVPGNNARYTAAYNAALYGGMAAYWFDMTISQ